MAVDTALARQEHPARDITAADPEAAAGALAHILGTGDLSKLSEGQKSNHYLHLCASLGLNPASLPFIWVEFYDPETKGKKLVLYPTKSCAEQIRRQHQIRVRVVEEKIVGTLFKVVVEGTTPNGRTGEEVGYVPLTWTDRDHKTHQLAGQRLANAFMKAHTVAKRRLTFSMVGLAAPPEMTELQDVRQVYFDAHGRMIENPTPEQKMLAENPAIARVIGERTFETVGDASESPLAGTPSQAVRPEELERPQRPAGPRPSFRASEEDIRRWCGAWFAIVDETPWDTKEARARFVAEFTEEWPEAKRTDSMRTMFARCQEIEARDFLAKIRAVVIVWKEGQAAEANGEPELGSDVGLTPETAAEEIVSQEGRRSYEHLFPDDEAPPGPPSMTPEGHAAAVLTGAPPRPAREEEASPELFDPSRQYSRPELFDHYEHWASRMKALDSLWKADDVKRLPDKALRAAVEGLSSQVADLEDHLARFGGDEEPTDDDQGETETAF